MTFTATGFTTTAVRIVSRIGCTIEWVEIAAGEPFPEAWELFGNIRNGLVVNSTRIREALGYSEELEPEACIDDLVTPDSSMLSGPFVALAE